MLEFFAVNPTRMDIMQKVKVLGRVTVYYWGPTLGFQATDLTIPIGIELEVSDPSVKDELKGDFVVFDTSKIPGTNRTQAYALREEVFQLRIV